MDISKACEKSVTNYSKNNYSSKNVYDDSKEKTSSEDSNDEVEKVIDYDDNGIAERVIEYWYDDRSDYDVIEHDNEKGYMTSWSVFEDNKLKEKREFEYNRDGKLARETQDLDGDGEVDFSYKYFYNEDGYLARIETPDYITEFYHDQDGVMTGKETTKKSFIDKAKEFIEGLFD